MYSKEMVKAKETLLKSMLAYGVSYEMWPCTVKHSYKKHAYNKTMPMAEPISF